MAGGAGGVSQDPFELIFEADADAAQYWWRTLRRAKPAGESPGATMRRVRALLTGSASAADLANAAKAAAGTAPSVDATDGQAADWWANQALALAAAYRAAGKPDDAIAALAEVADRLTKEADDEKSRSARRYAAGSRGWVFGIDERFRFWVELGDLLSEQGRHKDAAARLEQGWRKYPDNPVLLYLSGRALQKAGDEQEGRRRMELAHWVALGNARLRGRFLEELSNRGATADAKRERDLAREAGWVAETYIGNVWNQVARASVLGEGLRRRSRGQPAGDPLPAPQHRGQLRRGVRLPDGAAGRARVCRRSLLAAGKVDEAVALAKECLTVMPGNSSWSSRWCRSWTELGRKKEADELFKRVWDAYGAVIERHPNSGWARYSAAWVAAGCRRELDAALVTRRRRSSWTRNCGRTRRRWPRSTSAAASGTRHSS